MKKKAVAFLFFVVFLASYSTFASIPWAGDYFCLKNLQERVTVDPLVVSEADTLHFFVSVYKPGVTEGEGEALSLSARFYVDAPKGLFFPMHYVRDEGNNDVYGVELKPWMLKSGQYRFGISVSDEPVLRGSHWSQNNFYWVTKTSYGYTNPSYPNHEWIHSFRTLEVIEDQLKRYLPFKK